MVVPEPIRWIDGFGPNHRSDVALRSSPRRHRATAPRDAGSVGEAAGSPRQECPVELKSTIDRWNKRWPGDRDGRERPAWGGGGRLGAGAGENAAAGGGGKLQRFSREKVEAGVYFLSTFFHYKNNKVQNRSEPIGMERPK